MEGYNCTVIAYGQTGTGKTHSMVGVNGGSDGLLYKSTKMMGKSVSSVGDTFDDTATREAGNALSKIGESVSNLSAAIIEDVDPEAEGMIPRTIASVFALMKKASASTEFTIRVTYVEIYLEKVLDLLNPIGTTSITIEEEEQADKAAGPTVTPAGVRIKGASELCCLDEADVCALLTRGNACRTMSSTEMNTESSRSHAIFVLRLEQTDRLTSTTKSSVLHMVDLAGSELASKEAANKRKSMVATISAVQTEALMINKSLNALSKMIRAQLAHQQGEQGIPLDSISRQSKLTRLLRPSFGGNCLTTLLLTASPSSYNIGETISTINFGQRCRRIYNDPNIVETQPAHVYRKQLQEFKSNYEDAMGLARALASECLRMRDGESTGKGPLWDTIEHLGRKENPPLDFKVTIKQKKLKADDSESESDEEVAYFSNAKVKMEDEIEGLNEENEFLTRQRQDVDGHLAELQSEVAVLRTQNENLAVEKERNVEELVNAKNEVQSLSQRKLEVEHNLRTSQFRENEVIVFLRQFRRFYRNVLKDKAAHGAGSIKAITAEVTDKVPNAPNLNDLRDIDSLLVESGILEDYEMGEDKGSGSYIPSRDALMRSAAAAQRAAESEAEFLKEGAAESDDDDDDDQYAARSITRVPGPLRLPGPGVQMDTITEMNNSEVKQDETSDESDARSEADRRAGADAGAGTTPMDDRSFLSSDTGSMAHSISRVPATGPTVTRRQILLNTPSGRLTISSEKNLERELHEISERCIDLQMALNEEKAVVDALTNKAGGLSKKRLAQEAITLRQELEKKVASLTAIAWKMNELNLINKTNNEKMASREQHLAYLEMQLDGMQNNNRELIVARVESEKKLRDEIESFRSIVGGMTVPLWQFGEKNILDKPLASRVVVTAVGGDPSSDFEFDPFKRRKSVGAQEPEMEFPEIPDIPLYDDSASVDDVSMDRDEFLLEEEMPEPPKRPKRRTSDQLRMSVNKLRAARMLMRSMASQASVENDQDKPVLTGRSIEVQAPPPPIAVETCNVETQTGGVQIFELDEKVTLDRDKPETCEADVQTDDIRVYDIDIPMTEDYQRELYDADMQTDDVQVFDIDIPMVEDSRNELFDADVQTDDVQVSDIDTPMIADDKEMNADVQTDEVQVFEIGTAISPAHEDVETDEFGIQTDDEPLKQVFERNLQTDDVQFVVRSQLLGGASTTISENNEEEADGGSLGQESRPENGQEFNSENEGSSDEEIEQEKEHDAYSSPEEQSDEQNAGQSDDEPDEEYDAAIKPLGSLPELLGDMTPDDREPAETNVHHVNSFNSENEEEPSGSENEFDAERAAENDMADARDEEGNGSSEDDSSEESQNEHDADSAEERVRESAAGEDGDLGDTFEGDESARSEGEDSKLEAPVAIPVETPEVDAKAEPKESARPVVAGGRSALLTGAQSDTAPRSRDLSPMNRFMQDDQSSRRASNRFMPAEEGLSASRRLAGRRFLLDDNVPSRNDSLRLSPAASSRRISSAPLLEDDKLVLDVANDNDFGYDDLGTRWGMTDDEIAADSAILNKPRRESNTLLSDDGDGDMEEEVKEAEIVEAPNVADEVLEDDSSEDDNSEDDNSEDENSEDGLKRDLFDNDFDLKRSLHSTSPGTGPHVPAQRNRGLQEQFDDQSDHDEPQDDGVSKLSHDSFTGDEQEEEAHDDDFDIMMTEAAAALAAADELMGADTEEVSEHEDTDYDESDVDLSSDDDEEYVSEDGDSEDGNEMEFRSAQDKRFSVREEDIETQDTERNVKLIDDPDPSKLFEGGKTQDYVLREFTDKTVMDKIKPAVTKGSSRKVELTAFDDDGSIVSTATNKNREAPQKSPLRPTSAAQDSINAPESVHSAGSSLLEKNSSSSRRRGGEGRSDRKKSSKRKDGDRSHRSSRRESDTAGGEAKERDRRSRRSVDGDGEAKERRSRRGIDGDGESKEKSRRSRRSVDGDGEAKERERRSRRELDEGGEESTDRRSRRSKDEEGGSDRRHRSSRREGGGEHRSGTRHKSSRHLGDRGSNSTRHKSSRRLQSSNGDLEEGEKRHRSNRHHRSEEDGNGEGEGERSKRRSRDEDKARKSKKSSSSRHRSRQE
jgi:hypothetical protein